MYYYTAFGLRITSEIEFPELLERSNDEISDITIQFGSTPKALERSCQITSKLWINPKQYLLHIEDQILLFVENGISITVERRSAIDAKIMRLYVLSSAMAAVLHQRGLIPLHASGILTPEGVVLFIGDCGAGKSTTLKGLVEKGYSIFTDDICALRHCDDEVFGIPSYPVVKLWDNSFELLQLDGKKEENRLWPDGNKYGLFFHDNFSTTWSKISKIFVLEIDETVDNSKIQQQTGIEAFKNVGMNTYGNNYVDPMKANHSHFRVVSTLLTQCEVYKIKRPSKKNSVSELINLIEENL